MRINNDGIILPLFKAENLSENRQSLEDFYIPNGAIYIFKISTFLKQNQFPIQGSIPFFMDEEDSFDIDDKRDLCIVRKKIKKA